MSAIIIFGSAVPLRLSINPLSASGVTTGTRAGLTNAVTVTPLNGNGPYTYSWVKIEGDDMYAESPSSAITRFTGTVPIGEVIFATFRCTVTDSSNSTATIDVNATLIDGSWGSQF